MPSIIIHPRPASYSSANATTSDPANPLPTVLHTPLGLAIIEIQGTLNIPPPAQASAQVVTASEHDTSAIAAANNTLLFPIGRLVFPLLRDGDQAADGNGVQNEANGAKEGPWMKKAYLYIGQNQRLAGEVRKLGKVLAVLRKREREGYWNGAADGVEGGAEEELEIADLIKWKLVFPSRPEFV